MAGRCKCGEIVLARDVESRISRIMSEDRHLNSREEYKLCDSCAEKRKSVELPADRQFIGIDQYGRIILRGGGA